MKSAGGGHNEVGSMSPRPQLAGVREIGANGSGREGGGAGGGPGGPALSQSISLDRERSVRDAATETEGDGDAGRRIDFATYSRVFEENAHLSKQLAEAQVCVRARAFLICEHAPRMCPLRVDRMSMFGVCCSQGLRSSCVVIAEHGSTSGGR